MANLWANLISPHKAHIYSQLFPKKHFSTHKPSIKPNHRHTPPPPLPLFSLLSQPTPVSHSPIPYPRNPLTLQQHHSAPPHLSPKPEAICAKARPRPRRKTPISKARPSPAIDIAAPYRSACLLSKTNQSINQSTNQPTNQLIKSRAKPTNPQSWKSATGREFKSSGLLPGLMRTGERWGVSDMWGFGH